MTGKRAVSISWATPEHAQVLIPLLVALHRHDLPGAPHPCREAVAAHAVRLLDPATPHRLAIAWNWTGVALGLAAVAFVTSISDLRAEHCRQLDLKELFVLPDARGDKVGAALMTWIEEQARIAGACRIDWHVKRDNARGIAFYERHGGTIVADRLSMRKSLGAS